MNRIQIVIFLLSAAKYLYFRQHKIPVSFCLIRQNGNMSLNLHMWFKKSGILHLARDLKTIFSYKKAILLQKQKGIV